MTVSEYIMAYQSCAINNVPWDEAKRIAEMFPTSNRHNHFLEWVDLGYVRQMVHMLFRNGSFYAWSDDAGPYNMGSFSLQSTIWFRYLEPDDDEIDVSFDILADIL